ncbi:hypothetical protein N9Q27_00655 [bacterium]|nr:hypothetical protein [bacterium]
MRVKIGGYPDYQYWLDRLFGWNPKQKISVRIDPHDTWSMDHTLAHIITPMLVQLKETQHGYPADLTEQEWDDILDEMIWAFEQKSRVDWDEDFYEYEDDDTQQFGVRLAWEDKEGAIAHQDRMSNGFRLFGKYYENLWD